MLILEIVSDSSRDFFDGIPDNRHELIVNYCDMCTVIAAKSPGLIKVGCVELVRSKFFACGFQPFDLDALFSDFADHCRKRQKECVQIMQVGYFDDLKEFIDKFIYNL